MATQWWLEMEAHRLSGLGDYKAAFEVYQQELVPKLKEQIKPKGRFDSDPIRDRVKELSKQLAEVKSSEEYLLDELDRVRNQRDDFKERLDAITEAISPVREVKA